MEKYTKRQALEEIALFLLANQDIKHLEYIKKLEEIKKMSATQVSAEFKKLHSAINGKAAFNTDDKILKEFDKVGTSKSDVDIIESKPFVPEKKKEFSQKYKMQKIAAKLNSTTNPALKEIAATAGSNLWKWKASTIDVVFDSLETFKN